MESTIEIKTPTEIRKKPMIEITDENREKIATVLNTLVADEFVLYTKTRAAHWNIQGKNFGELHKFFEKQYDELEEIIDETAERVRMLGHFAVGSLRDFLAITNMTEDYVNTADQDSVIQALLTDHESIIRIIRNNIPVVGEKFNDMGTADFITGVMEQHEKMAWMLRSYIS